jgi:hypothetical protein
MVVGEYYMLEDQILGENSFSPFDILENLKKANLDPSIFETIDETAFPKAPNFLEFAIGPSFLNTLILPKQVQIGSYLFCDFCPRCSKPGYIDTLFDQSVGNIRDNIVFLEHGTCPECKRTRFELVQKKELIFRNELVGVCGQRCIPKDSLVYSQRGLLSLEKVIEKDILTHGSVLKKIDSGELSSLVVTTEYDYTLTGAKESHIVPVIKKDRVENILLKECCVGDYLLLNKAGLFSKTMYSFDTTGNDPTFSYPDRMNLDLAKIFGMLSSKAILVDSFNTWKVSCPRKYHLLFKQCFGWVTRDSILDDEYFLHTYPFMQKWFERIGLTAANRIIPECILQSPKEIIVEFLKTFLDIKELSFNKAKKVTFIEGIHSQVFIKQFRLLLLNLGFLTKPISDYEIAILSAKKIPASLLPVVPENCYPVVIKSIEDGPILHMMDVQIPNTNLYTADGFVHHNSGKTKLVALLAAYVNHRFLKIPNPVRTYNQTSGDILMGTFSALSLDHSYRNLWQAFKGFIDSSPWFQNYHRFLKGEEKKLGIELFHELKASMFYTHKHLLWNATGSQDRKMRGDTRIFGAIDELGWMISDENKKDLQNMNADAIYTALSNSLTTMRTKYNQVWNSDSFDLPPILMANISSPSSAKDKIMRLLKDAKRNEKIYAVHLATWMANPDYNYETLREEHAHVDELTFMRDFGGEPPLASNPFLTEARAIDKIAVGPMFDGFSIAEYQEKDFLGDYYKSLKFTLKKGDKVVPRLISFDLGSFKNSLAVCMFSLTPDAKPRLDFAAVVRPDPKTKVRVNIADFFENFTMPLVNSFSIKYAFFDRWQSLDQIERLKLKDVNAAVHSLTYKEMDSVRGSILSQSIIIPKMEKPIEDYVKEYIEDVYHTDPLALLGLQLLTVRDMGHKMAKPLLGDDDVFRAFCLGVVRLSDPHIKKEYMSGSAVKTNTGHTIAHLGVVRTRKSSGGGAGGSSFEGENGKHLGSIRSRYKK